MNKRGVTILELLISISLISVVILLLLKLIFSLDNINNSKEYASEDEIARTTIIKNIESDFLKLKLMGVRVKSLDKKVIITFNYLDRAKDLIIEEKSLSYDNQEYKLNSVNATYNLCPSFSYKELDKDYYLVNLNIEVLIDGKSNTKRDDIDLFYVDLISDNVSYPRDLECSK